LVRLEEVGCGSGDSSLADEQLIPVALDLRTTIRISLSNLTELNVLGTEIRVGL